MAYTDPCLVSDNVEREHSFDSAQWYPAQWYPANDLVARRIDDFSNPQTRPPSSAASASSGSVGMS
jgi:hypothetical protein